MTNNRQDHEYPGSIGAISWACKKDLPPAQKLVLLYMADAYRTPQRINEPAIARFAGVAIHEIPDLLDALVGRGLIVGTADGEYSVDLRA